MSTVVEPSKEEPQYIIKSDKTDHLAIHKGSALKKIKKRKETQLTIGRRVEIGEVLVVLDAERKLLTTKYDLNSNWPP